MTTAGMILTAFVVPVLVGQVVYALTRGKPTPGTRAAGRDSLRRM